MCLTLFTCPNISFCNFYQFDIANEHKNDQNDIPPIKEGTLISRALGTLKQNKIGWCLHLEKEIVNGKTISREIPVFPSNTLEMYEIKIKRESLSKDLKLRVIGEVFLYKGRNLIDLLSIEILKKQKKLNVPSDAPVDINFDNDGNSYRDPKENAPSIDTLMKELEKSIPVVGNSSQEYLRKNTKKNEIVFFRSACLKRNKRGVRQLVFDSNNIDNSEPVAIILPSSKLMSLEAGNFPNNTKLLVCGKKRTYKEKNYFLLENWRISETHGYISPIK